MQISSANFRLQLPAILVQSVILILFLCCRQRYDPPLTQKLYNYLVVEGVLINGADTTFLRLSRARKLDDNPQRNGEQNARLSVEDAESGFTVYNFTPAGNNGLYMISGMKLNLDKKYRLRITTTDGNHYVSDDISVISTPSIDSVSWIKKNDGVYIYVNTHGSVNDGKYYQWNYRETWYFTVPYLSARKYKYFNHWPVQIDSMFPLRDSDKFVQQCWKTLFSSQILQENSSKLSDNIISLAPIRYIPAGSVELSSLYSILVNQYCVSKDAYEYFENLKKTSEQTGSIFDPQPTQLKGNIHNLDKPDDPVFGYVAASSTHQVRIFIKNADVQPWVYYDGCQPPFIVPVDSIPRAYDTVSFPALIRLAPLDIIYNNAGDIIGVSSVFKSCGDCTSSGGVTTKPDFWP